MKEYITILKDIFLGGTRRAGLFLQRGYFIPKSDDDDDKEIVILTMRELKEITKMFRELCEESNNLIWRLKTDAE